MGRTYFKGGTLLAPVPPALITAGTVENGNIMTAAWTGILCSDPPKTYVSIRPSRHSHGMITEGREFVINLPMASQAKETDYCGIYTGAKVNKFEKCKFTPVESEKVSAPTIAECPLALECCVTEIVPLGTHDMFIADIVSVSVDDRLLDESGKLHMERADLLAYAHGEYYALGRRLGTFGFSARKKKNNKGRRK